MIEFADEVLEKAVAVVKQQHIRPDDEHYGIWWVVSLNGPNNNIYRTQALFDPDTGKVEWITCTCAHGLHRGGDARCYHAAAVWLTLEAGVQ
jgi:hypothetical protein